MLALVVFGLAALLLLKTDEFPDVQPPIVVVSVLYPGASPENVEREVIEPVEDAISGISGVTADPVVRRSTASRVIIVEFVFEKDLQEATQEIRDEISADPQRPAARDGGADPDAVRPDRPARSCRSRCRRRRCRARSSRCSPTRASPGGCAGCRASPRSTVVGGVERELTVELRPQALQAAGVSVAQVVQRAAGAEPRGAGRPAARRRSTSGRSGCAAGSRRRPTSSSWWSSESQRPARPPRRRGRRARRHRGAALGRALQRRRGRRHRHHEVEGLQHDRRGRRRSATRSARLQTTLPPGATLRIVRDAGVRVAQLGGRRRGRADRGRGAHRARRLPVPQLVALDRHHRPRAAGLGARVVHRGAGRSASR